MCKMEYNHLIIILGTAHDAATSGKRSPDGKFREYKYSREICAAVKAKLEAQGYTVYIDCPEDNVASTQNAELVKRVKFVNDMCYKYGTANCIYVSIHNDAAGSGSKWMTAGGWTAYTSVGKTNADKLAECLYDAAETHLKPYVEYMAAGKQIGAYDAKQKPFRIDMSDGDRDKEANFYVLKNTKCPAVLTENLFQDNKADVDFLLSDNGRQAIINLHAEGIIKYVISNNK